MDEEARQHRALSWYLVVAVVALAWSRPDAGVGNDGAAYLHFAEHLAQGGGLDAPAATPSGVARFAVWPPGYPVLIALFTALPGVSAWWAARIVSALCVLVAAWGAERLTRGGTLALLPLSVVTVFAWTASEGPMLAAAIVLATALADHDAEHRPRHAAVAALAATVMGFVRWIGLVGALVLAGAAVHAAWRGDRRDALHRALGASVAFGSVGLWLAANAAATGHATGMERLPAPESWTVLIVSLARATVSEALLGVRQLTIAGLGLQQLVVTALLQLALVVWVFRAPGRDPSGSRRWRWPAVLGGTYLVALIVLRFRTHFDLFGWRLLAPGTALLLLAALATTARWSPVARQRLTLAIGAPAVLGLFVDLLPAVGGGATQPDVKARVLARYAALPSGCVVGPHDVQMPWVRPDLVPASPAIVPYAREAESVTAFRDRLVATPHACAAVEVRDDLDPRRVHPSWIQLAADHPDGTFLLLR